MLGGNLEPEQQSILHPWSSWGFKDITQGPNSAISAALRFERLTFQSVAQNLIHWATTDLLIRTVFLSVPVFQQKSHILKTYIYRWATN